jgi:hypothetical protein
MKMEKLIPALEHALTELTANGQTVRLDNLIAYQKAGHLYLEWADGHTICKPLPSKRNAA